MEGADVKKGTMEFLEEDYVMSLEKGSEVAEFTGSTEGGVEKEGAEGSL